jgi:hypothetical protein
VEEDTQQTDGVPLRSPLLFSSMCLPSLSCLYLSCGSPKFCVGARTTKPLHAVVLREFWIWSKPIYFHNLGWIRDSKVVIIHRMCTIPRKVVPFEAPGHYDGVFATSSSTRPWGQLHHQTLARERNPHIRSMRDVTDLQLIVIALLIDRSRAIQGCVHNNFFLLASNPNSGIRARSMRSMLVRLEHIVICGQLYSRCYPPMLKGHRCRLEGGGWIGDIKFYEWLEQK